MEYLANTNSYTFPTAPLHLVQDNETDLIPKSTGITNKKSFLVYKKHSYRIIPTHMIAYFYVKFGGTVFVTIDLQEYNISYSLEQVQQMVSGQQFFRLNRQYLINFSAVKEVEHYFSRKLLVKLSVEAPEKLLVSKEKSSSFLNWLENR